MSMMPTSSIEIHFFKAASLYLLNLHCHLVAFDTVQTAHSFDNDKINVYYCFALSIR